MKISKRIYIVLSLWGLFFSGKPLHSMVFARTALVALKKEGKKFFDKMPIGAVLDYKQEQKNIEHFKTNELFLQDVVPVGVRAHITNLFENNGLTVSCVPVFQEQWSLPYVAITCIGSKALLLMNDQSLDALYGKNKDGFTREHICAVIKHEVGHAVHRHTEKQFLVESASFSLRAFSGSAFFYQNMETVSHLSMGALAGHSDFQWGLCAAALTFFLTGKASQNFFSRFCERQADQFVLKTSTREEIKAYRDFFDKLRIKAGDIYFWRTSSHPRYTERIEACDKALAEMGVVKK